MLSFNIFPVTALANQTMKDTMASAKLNKSILAQFPNG